MADNRFTGREIATFGGFFLLVFLLLGVVPFALPTRADVSSVASTLGYDGNAAYFFLLAVSLLWIAAFHWQAAPAPGMSQPAEWQPPATPSTRRRITEIGVVSAGILLLYCPWFLSRYGPYIEDNFFLSVLHRMHGGQRPYADFEFLYGPLLIYPQFWFQRAFGYSMKSYYAFQAMAEAAAYALLLWNLQKWIPESRKRMVIFALVSVLLINTVLGMNYNGLRRLLPVLGLVALSVRPAAWRTTAGVSVLFGLLLAYSHELAVAALLGSTALFVLHGYACRKPGGLLHIPAMWGIAAAVWFLTLTLILGNDRQVYLQSTAFLLKRFTAGEQAFPFRWSLNSLCAFALLGMACSLVGRGLRAARAGILPGDRLMAAALVYALIGLRAGLNRSDIWHLLPPLLGLILAFLLPLPRHAFASPDGMRRVSGRIVFLLAATYLLSLAPFGSFYAAGLARGFLDSFRPLPGPTAANTRAPSIELERSRPDPAVLQLSAFLARPENRERPVLFYSRLWALDKRVGTYNTVYLPDDFFMTDAAGYEISRFVSEKHPIAILQEPVYKHLFETIDPKEYARYLDRQPMTPAKMAVTILSTPFFRDLPVEWKLKEERWEHTVAPSLSNYRRITSFGPYVVMMPE